MYIDPGLGSLCFQALAALLIGIGVFFGKAKLLLFWRKRKGASTNSVSDRSGNQK